MWTNRPTRAAALIAIAIASAACETGTVPDVRQDFDADAALEDFEAMERALASDDLEGFRAMGERTPFGDSPAAIDAMAGMTDEEMDDDGRSFAVALTRRLDAARSQGGDGPARGPIISGWHRGTTFVYDPASDEYAPDLTREGAPDTGVRFVLYDVDESGKPIVDVETGYADLIDEGDGSVEDIALLLRVVQAEETIVEYRTTLDHDATSGALTVGGFLVGDGVRLDFDIALAAREEEGVGSIDMDFEIGVEQRDFSIVGRVTGVEEDEDGQGEIEVRHGPHSLRVDVVGADGVLDGTVFIDGEVFATVEGPAADPVILGADGEPLNWAEVLVLMHVLDAVEDVFDLVEDLVDPVDELVFLGFIL